jgi:beta-lactamase class A
VRVALVARTDVAPGWSPIAEEIQGDSQLFTVQSLLERAVGQSDNTAAASLIRRLGGIAPVQVGLTQAGIEGVRVDRMERELQPESVGLKADDRYSDEAVFDRDLEALPTPARLAAVEAYLHDERDTAKPSCKERPRPRPRHSAVKSISPRYQSVAVR